MKRNAFDVNFLLYNVDTIFLIFRTLISYSDALAPIKFIHTHSPVAHIFTGHEKEKEFSWWHKNSHLHSEDCPAVSS